MSKPTQYEIELLTRAKARVARSQVRYGDKIAYPDDCKLMLDLIGQIESLRAALDATASLEQG
jgi:hypothetical protein